MKIAIKGDKHRGFKVIEILKSLGGKMNGAYISGNAPSLYYSISEIHNNMIVCHSEITSNYKVYTIDEFEKVSI